MRIGTIVKEATDIPVFEAEIILASVLQKDRSWILAHSEDEISADIQSDFLQKVQRRASHEPIAYITGFKEFYGRDFIVNSSVLIPRPSTETLIEMTVDFLKNREEKELECDTEIICTSKWIHKSLQPEVIVDIGTGSGCIAITLALELPQFEVVATDISKDALNVAVENAKKYNVEKKIIFEEGDGLNPLISMQKPFLLVSNPPYIPQDETLMKDVVDFEPHSALFGGESGKDIVERILYEAEQNQFCSGIVLECRKGQM